MPITTGTARPGLGLPGDVLPSAPRLLEPDVPGAMRLATLPNWVVPNYNHLYPCAAGAPPYFGGEPTWLSKWEPHLEAPLFDARRQQHTYPALAASVPNTSRESTWLAKWEPHLEKPLFDVVRRQDLAPTTFEVLVYPNFSSGQTPARPGRAIPGKTLPKAPIVLGPDVPSLMRVPTLPVWDVGRLQYLAPHVTFFKPTTFTQPAPTVSDWAPNTDTPLFDRQRTAHLALHSALVKATPFTETVFLPWWQPPADVVRLVPRCADLPAIFFDPSNFPNVPNLVVTLPGAFDVLPRVQSVVHLLGNGAWTSLLTTLAGPTDAFPDVAFPGETLPDAPTQVGTPAALAAAFMTAVQQPLFGAPPNYLAPTLFQAIGFSTVEPTLLSKYWRPASEPVRDVVRQQHLYPALSPIDAKQLLSAERLFLQWFRATEQPLFRGPRHDWVFPVFAFWPQPLPNTGNSTQYLLLLGIGS